MGTSIKFTGLASGLDTESLVSAMLAPYKTKVDTSKQASELSSMKKDAYKEINSKVYAFYTGTLSNMRLQSSFNKSTISSSVSGIVETSTGSLPSGSHTIKVDQLAQSANLETFRVKTKNNDYATKTNTLDDLGIDFSNGDVELELSDGKNTNTVTLNGSMTLAEVESAFKTALPDANVSFNASLGAFSISSKETGASQSVSVSITNGDQTALSKLGFSVKNENGINVASAKGTNTQATYNGMHIDTETNEIEINGAKMTLVGTGTTILSSNANTNDTYTMITEFVSAYNTLLDEINGLVYAEANNTYKPLTDEQKEAMSEDEIKKWNDRINKSILRNDSTLKDVATLMRQSISDAKIQVGTNDKGEPVYMTMASIGISTSANWAEKGKLHIDETKLKAALKENPEAVTRLFAGTSDGTDKSTDGAMTTLYSKLGDKFKAVPNQKSNGSLFNDKALEKTILEQKQKTEKLITKMDDMEDLYYTRFTAMEKMLSSLNSQSSYFASMLG